MCQGRPIRESVRRTILRMARAGSSMRTIAATLGISLATVFRVLKAKGS